MDMLLADRIRLDARERKIISLATSALSSLASRPPPQYWLSSDATNSYCWSCARAARASELRLPIVPPELPFYRKAEADYEFDSGIDGGDWYSGEADTPQACETCRCTLNYHLTAYGCREEIGHFFEDPITPEQLTNRDSSFELMRALDASEWFEEIWPEAVPVARTAIVAARQAKRLQKATGR